MTDRARVRRWRVACALTGSAAVWFLAALVPAAHPLFGLVCHQIPERSFLLFGEPVSVCGRCAGLYFGFLLGSAALAALIRRVPEYFDTPPRRELLLIAALPAIIEGGLEISGLLAGNPAVRAATGALFGIVVPAYFIPAVDEMITEAHAEIVRLITLWEKAHAATRAR